MWPFLAFQCTQDKSKRSGSSSDVIGCGFACSEHDHWFDHTRNCMAGDMQPLLKLYLIASLNQPDLPDFSCIHWKIRKGLGTRLLAYIPQTSVFIFQVYDGPTSTKLDFRTRNYATGYPQPKTGTNDEAIGTNMHVIMRWWWCTKYIVQILEIS